MLSPASRVLLLTVTVSATAVAGAEKTEPDKMAETRRQEGFVVTQNGNSFNIEAKGNLAPNKPFKGTTLEEIEPDNNPIDLLRRAIELWPENPRAAYLLKSAGVLRAAFDALRVSDFSAASAAPYAFDQNPAAKRITIWSSLSPSVGQAETKALLAWARKAGPPTYHPSWMIQHGMSATGIADKKTREGLQPDFDAAATWKMLCDNLEGTANDDAAWKARMSQRTPETIQAMLDYMENGVGKNLDARAPTQAEAAKAEIHAIIAKFDPAGRDPAMQYVEIYGAVEKLTNDAIDRHRGRK